MKRWALLIGINEYQTFDLDSFRVFVNNVTALDALLQRAGYETLCMHNELPESNSQFPTNQNIRAAVNQILNSARADDFVLVYFAGLTSNQGGAWGVLPYDASSKSDGLLWPVLQRLWEQRQYQKSDAVQTLFLLDLVVDDLQDGAKVVSDVYQAALPDGLSLMMLATPLNNSIAQQNQQSPLADAILKGLEGRADEAQKGFVTIADLTQYLSREVQSLVEESALEIAGPIFRASSQNDVPLLTFDSLSVNRQPHRVQCFTEPAMNLDLVLIPGGAFTMGSPPDEIDRYDDEGPQHEVSVPTFLMGRYPITQAQWRTIASRDDLQVKQSLDPETSYFKGDDHDHHPVEQVSWYDAVEFCARLSRLTEHSYRLPTEAEWEYACRGGSKTPFHFGETITTDLANYCGTDDESMKWSGNYGRGPKGVYRETTTPVKHFHPLANAYGLCDLHGNVSEWCLDHWHDNYEGAPTDGSAWLTEDENASRVRRGGSWSYDPRHCRSACRYNNNPVLRTSHFGFRLVCEARGL